MRYRGAIAFLLSAGLAVLATARARAEFVGAGEYIAPMVKVSWNQRTPWNFYLPVLGNDARDGGYVGCVGTMLSQLLTVHQWPARVEVPLERSFKLEYASPISGGYRERMSFNDEVPLPWAEAAAVKSPATYRAKHAAARVCLFVDLLTDMKFLQTGADSTIGNCMNPDQTPYYEVDEVLNVATFTAEQLAEKIYPSLAKGCPVGVEILYENRMGHAVIIDGWDARDPSAVPKIHLNYGWEGLYNGWYELLQTPDTLRNLSLGFRPKPRAQFAPLSNRTAGSASLAWDFPAYWAERGLSGWTLACESSAGQSPQTLTDPFTALLDPVVALDTQNERKPLFAVGPITDGSHDATNGSAEANYLLVTTVLDVHAKTYTWPQLFVPEAASTLTFRAQSCYARNEALVLELRAGNAPWRVIHTFTSADETKGTEEAISLPLGDYANRPCQLRLRLQRTHVSGTEAVYENQVAYRLRDWQISQATPLVAAGEVTVSDPAARTYTASGLAEGTAYAWRITPRFADASPEGLASAPVSTLAASTGAALPTFLSVTSPAGTALDEECRRACAPAGRTTLRVKLSAGATPLAPCCQNRDLLSEEDFSITSRGNDTYDLSFTMAGKSAKAISAYTSNAILLTLRATDSDGNLAARDVMLQFVAGTASDPDPTPGETPDPAADPVIPDEDLGGHYPYEIHRSYWIARWEAIRQGKLLFVLSGADWCSWCSRVKDYLKTIPDFEKDFVVYFASRDSYDYSPYFSGGLPQYGTADPRQANPFAGVAQSDGSMAWSNAWTAAGSGLLYARRGYDEASISAAVSTARAAYPGGIPVGDVESPALTIKGPTHVLAGSPTAYTLAVTFPDSVEMALDHRVKWEVLSGNATLTEAGVLTASAPGAITLRATNFHDFPGTSAELAVTALEASAITALDIPVDTLNLAADATPQLPCLATFSDGTQAAILPSTWSVAYVENSFSSLPNFGTGYTPEPKLAADGTLSYVNTSVANHKLSVTAAMAGGPSVTREVTVYGPRQMIPSQVTLLSSQRVSAGSVVRLKVSELSYNDGTEVNTTGETALANYYLTVNEGYTSVASSRTPDWTIALGPSFATAPSGTTLSAKVAASAQNSAYTSYEAWPNLTHALTYIPAGEVVEQGKYGNVPSGWLEAYFPGTEHTAAQAQEDSDGDGYANWEEFILGTEPDQAADAFAFTSQHFSAMVSDATINLYYKVMYTLRSGREYTLQAKVNWSDPWQDVGIIDADKRTQPEVLNQPLADSANFFRVSVRFSKESGSYTYTEESVIPNGLAIAPGAVLELDGAQPLALTALAMDDYAPGNPLIRLPEGLAPGTVILSAPANCSRWIACFRPADPAAYAFEVTPSADGKRLELRTASPFNPQPKPPTGDPTGDFRSDIKAQLAEAARNAGFTQDFSLRMPERGGSFAEPSVDRVQEVMDCFSGLALEPNAAENTLTIHYDFGINSMAFVTLEGSPCVVFGAKVTSQVPGSAEPSQADFAEGASLALFGRTNLGEASAQATAVEVTDPSGTTAGQCTTPGQRYFRYPLPQDSSTRFFSIRVSR